MTPARGITSTNATHTTSDRRNEAEGRLVKAENSTPMAIKSEMYRIETAISRASLPQSAPLIGTRNNMTRSMLRSTGIPIGTVRPSHVPTPLATRKRALGAALANTRPRRLPHVRR